MLKCKLHKPSSMSLVHRIHTLAQGIEIADQCHADKVASEATFKMLKQIATSEKQNTIFRDFAGTFKQ